MTNQPCTVNPCIDSLEAYAERGLPAIPASGKVPAIYTADGWKNRHRWQEFASRLPTEFELEQWAQWPVTAIAMPMGGISGLVAIDVDMDGEVAEAVERALSGLLICRKRGRKGWTAFMRTGDGLWRHENNLQSRWDMTRVDSAGNVMLDARGKPMLERMVDIIGFGKQTILPPSLHPSGDTYAWTSEVTLENCNLDYDLPECPVDLVERITAALAPFQTDTDRAADAKAHRIERINPGSDSWCRNLNDHALANLHAWVPDLINAKYLKQSGEGYRAVPTWRGIYDSHKCSIHPNGIQDFASGETFTPINLVMAVRNIESRDAMAWLARRSQMPDAPVALVNESALLSIPSALTAIDTRTGELVPLSNRPGVVPHFVLEPPGILGDVARYITATAMRPQPQLSVVSALMFCATCMAQIYAGPTDSRTNLYMVAIADSGSGKDHLLKSVRLLLFHAGLSSVLGGSSIASGSALHSQVAAQPCTLYQSDEFGLLLQRLTSAMAGSHEREIMSTLMELYSSADSPEFRGKDYADRKMRKTTTTAYPCVNYLGVSTGGALFSALSSKDVASGFLNRFTIVEGEDQPAPVFSPASKSNIPASIMEWASAIRNPPTYGVDTLRGVGGPVRVGWGEGVEAMYRDFLLATDARMRIAKQIKPGSESMLVRLVEQAGKFALVAAGAVNPVEPVITREIYQWAIDYASYYSGSSMQMVDERMADSPFDARVKQAEAYIMRQGIVGASRRTMLRGPALFRSMDKREFESVIERLVDSGFGVMVQSPMSKETRLVAVANMPAVID